jgi:hypothetical protein
MSFAKEYYLAILLSKFTFKFCLQSSSRNAKGITIRPKLSVCHIVIENFSQIS